MGSGQNDRWNFRLTLTDLMLADHTIAHATLQPRYEGHTPRLQLVKPLEINIRAVRDNHAALREGPRAGNLDIAGLAFGHADEAQEMARQVQPNVQLDRGLCPPKRRPGEDRET